MNESRQDAAQQTQKARQAVQVHRRSLLSRLGLYFPALLMLALALGTAWLMQNTPTVKEEPAASANSQPQEVEYFMQDYALRTFDRQGRLSRSLYGDRLEVRSSDGSQQADGVTFEARNRDGSWLMARARTGRRSADGQVTTLSGGVHVRHVAAGGKQTLTDVYSEQVEVNEAQQRVLLRRGVKLVRGRQTLYSSSGELLTDTEKLRLSGRVKAVISQ